MSSPARITIDGVCVGCGGNRKHFHGCALRRRVHGHTLDGRSPEYKAWCALRTRCRNPDVPNYPLYGGRGITFAERWDDFLLFLADVGRRPSDRHQLDRINNNGNYEPGNVRWATVSEQARNRRTTSAITFRGRTASYAEWAEVTGISRLTLRFRIAKLHWSVEKALTAPLRITSMTKRVEELDDTEDGGGRET